ncbi:MAG: S-layer homology domain-containing protein [Butyricicoccus sp.]|nr:S-layer homology domain-containing protein [Butyricicoccus sp.]
MKKRILCALLVLALALGAGPAAMGRYEAMDASTRCVEFIESMEGFAEKPYTDGTGWYIGYGVACKQGEYAGGISRDEAEELLKGVLDECAEEVNAYLRKCGAQLNQGQFDALCSMTYNFGGSWLDESNRLPRYISRGIEHYSDRQIVNAFAAWCHVGGEVNENLLRRRIAEARMFLDGDYSGEAGSWCALVLDPGEGSVESDVFCFESGKSYGELPAAARGGYDFAGWETADGRVLDADDTARENLRVSAVWEQPELFPDVSERDWFCPSVTQLARLGVVGGFSDGTFRPAENVTNGQALKLITRAVGYSEKAAPEEGHWAENYRKFAVSKKFIGENDMEDLDAPISRDAIADLAAAALGLDTKSASGSPFADSSRGSVIALAKAGIVNGSTENGRPVYKGSSSITRAEISAVVCRISDYTDGKFIVFSDYLVPIRHELAASPYDRDLFYTEDSRVRYDDLRYDVQYGIDVSYYQKDIDWEAVAADGIDFAIIRVGYRGSNAGTLNEDERFWEYIEGATAAGLDVGLYIFSQAVNAEEAREEARYVLERIGDYEITYPIAFDWEPLNYSGSRSLNFNYSVLTDCALAFCEVIEDAGYTPMVYLNPSFAYLRYDISRLMNADKIIWLAHYTNRSNYLYDFQIWQYGSSGSVDGIAGRVDMDIAFVNYGAGK